jgi:hypothetical protein
MSHVTESSAAAQKRQTELVEDISQANEPGNAFFTRTTNTIIGKPMGRCFAICI